MKNTGKTIVKSDVIKKVSAKWWYNTSTHKWIHDDNIDRVLFSDLNQRNNLPKEFKNTKKKKFY